MRPETQTLWDRQELPANVLPPVPPPPGWIGQIASACAFAAGAGTPSASDSAAAEAASHFGLETGLPVIMILVDGLGLSSLTEHLAHAPTLRRLSAHRRASQTCAPSTTAAALTTFATGCLPGSTRMVGYSVRRGPDVMNLLRFAPGVDAATWQPAETIFETLGQGASCVVTDPKFVASGLTKAAMRGAAFVGASSLSERFAQAVQRVFAGVPLVYVYWAALDKAGHHDGPHSPAWKNALEDFDAELAGLLRAVQGRAQVMLTADHGMVETGERIDIAADSALSTGVELIAGEGRAVHVHAAEEAADVESRWRERLGDRAWVFNRDEIPSVIGPGPGATLVGDLLVMPKGRSVIVDSRTQSASSIAMRGVHGSLTAEEMLIPAWRLI